ncbi:MAG TPA: GMC family oxidoreductase, partial [Nitrolancea sp.]|nr:GMC family oxidoreductase [Nitrolancea sp.]
AATAFNRARVIGGCSAHNGCVALAGHRRDYDHWAELGNPGWEYDAVAPAFERARRRLRVRIPGDDEMTPYQAAFVAAAAAAGIPRVANLDEPDDDTGVGVSPANIAEGVRWNTAFAYLDPVRSRPNLTVRGGALVDRVIVEGGRAGAVEAIVDGRREVLRAGRIVLAAGAYGSPAILLRSGIGPAAELRGLGIAPVHDLPGVGRGLTDHPTTYLVFRGSAALNAAMAGFTGWLPDEQTLLKARSSRCREAFDLHLYAVSGRDETTGQPYYVVDISCVAPRSFGSLRLASAEPGAAPLIDHGYLSDPEGSDAAVLADGVELARAIAGNAPLANLLLEEVRLGSGPKARGEIADFVRRTIGIYYHPACSCRMGPTSDPLAVVDAGGRVHGLDNLFVCDASIFPVIMRANTNLPAAMLAEQLAESIGLF